MPENDGWAPHEVTIFYRQGRPYIVHLELQPAGVFTARKFRLLAIRNGRIGPNGEIMPTSLCSLSDNHRLERRARRHDRRPLTYEGIAEHAAWVAVQREASPSGSCDNAGFTETRAQPRPNGWTVWSDVGQSANDSVAAMQQFQTWYTTYVNSNTNIIRTTGGNQ